MKFSKYIVNIEDGSKVILYNTANCGTVRIDYDLFKKIIKGNLQALSEEEYQFLKQSGFIVEDDYDDKIIGEIEKSILNNGIHLTFITTEACNFRCSYCYEKHNNHSIKSDVYDSVIDYLRNVNKDVISVSWFGGEPTLCIREIKDFMNKLRNLNKFSEIYGTITTNGFLLTKKNFSTLINCGVNSFQVTVDGVQTEHDKFRYLKNKVGTFDMIIKNIKEIKETEYKYNFLIRNNYNRDSDLLRYVEFIYSIIGTDNRFKLFFSSTGTWSSSSEEIPFSCENLYLKQAIERAQELNIAIYEAGTSPNNSFCCANFEDSYIVNYKGELLKCTVKLDWDRNVVGHVTQDGHFVYNNKREYWRTVNKSQECKDCNVLPVCMGRYCPHVDYSSCSEIKQSRIKTYLRQKYISED